MAVDVKSNDGNRRGILTLDLLGDGDVAAVGSSMELDLDLQVPYGWERCLDLTSGKTYLHKLESNLQSPELHDLNLPPPSSNDSTILDLKLTGGGKYQSVCTLENVKLALGRADRTHLKGETLKRLGFAEKDEGMMAAACPSCLLYVLISKASMRCPRCDSHVPVPFFSKKPRFDLNAC